MEVDQSGDAGVYDEDDVAAVKLAMENSMHEQMEDMRRRLAYYEGSDN